MHAKRTKPVVNLRGATVCATALLGFSLLVWTGCTSEQAPSVDTDPVVIEIGDREVRVSELQAHVDFLAEQNRLAAPTVVEFVESYAERSVALAKAEELGLHEDVGLQRQIENLLIGRVKQLEFKSKLGDLEVSKEEVQAYYQSNLSEYTKPAQVRLALLFLEAVGEEAQVGVRSKLEVAREEAAHLSADTRGFGALSMKYSEDATSRFKGGDIGWLRAGDSRYRWPEAVVKAGFSLKHKGEMSSIIVTETGAYLLMKLDSRDAVVRPLDDDLAASISGKLLRQKRITLADTVQQSWSDDQSIVFHEDAISQINFTTTTSKKVSANAITQLP